MNHKEDKKNRPRFERHLIRPLVYQVFTRYLISLCIALLWARFIAPRVVGSSVSWGFQFFAAFYVVMAWMAWLRLDGVRMHTFDRKLFRRKKKPPIVYGDMIDHVDDPIPSFDDLEPAEKDLTLLYADIITALLFVLTSLLS